MLLIMWTLLAAVTTRTQINPYASDAGEGDVHIESASSDVVDYSSQYNSDTQNEVAAAFIHVEAAGKLHTESF